MHNSLDEIDRRTARLKSASYCLRFTSPRVQAARSRLDPRLEWLVGRLHPQHSDAGPLTQAAAAGQGVALGQSVIVADGPAAKHSIEPFRLRIPSDSAYDFVALPEAFDDPKIVAFGCWLRARPARDSV